MDQNHIADVNAALPDLSTLLEYPLLAPNLAESDIAQGCDLAKRYQLAAIVVRPSDVDSAMHWIPRLGTVVDWPYGNATTSVKTYATRDMLRRGAKEINTVMNTSKLLSRQFQYLEMELVQMADACHQSGAVLKVLLESQYLNDEHKILACRISKRAGVDYLASASLDDLALLKEYGRERIQLMYSGPVETLDDALKLRDAGYARIQTAAPAAILDAWKAKLEEAAQAPVIS